MKIDPFSQQIADGEGRLAGLRRRAVPPSQHQTLLPEAMQEIQATMEELRVAEEEMRQQNVALAEAHDATAAEHFRHLDLFEFAPDGYLLTDMQGMIREVNRAAQRLLGRSASSLKGRPLANAVAATEVRLFRQRLLSASRLQDAEEWEFGMRRRDGDDFPASLTVGVARDAQGVSTGLRWMIRDISRYRQVEEELRLLNEELEARVGERTADLEAALARERSSRRELEDAWERGREQAARIERLIDDAPVGFALLDTEGRCVSVNPALARRSGRPPEEHVGRLACEIVPERWPAVEPYFRRALGGETVTDVDLSGGSRPDGDASRHFLTSFYPIRADGQVVGVGTVVRDVTAHREAELAIQGELCRERTIAEALQRPLIRAVPDDKFPSLEIATFYEAALDEALVGGDFFDAFALDDDRIALVVGDVSGKGLDAAACTSGIKYALRPILRTAVSPADSLARLNDFVCGASRLGDWDRDVLVALTLAVIDTRRDEVICAVAGAEPPLALRGDAPPRPIDAQGLMLGIEAGRSFAQRTAPFVAGDILLMATDGVTEARRNGAFLDLDGLAALAARPRAGQPLEEFGRQILEGVRAYAGGPLQDDACILLAARR